MAGRKKKTTSVLGDDPLSWLGKDEAQDEQPGRDNNQPDRHTDVEQNVPVAASDVDAGSEPVSIILDPVITLTEVSHLKESLLGHVGVREIHVDVSKIEHIDTAGMQLLLAFSKTIQKLGGKLVWTGWSTVFSETAELLGLASAVGLKEK